MTAPAAPLRAALSRVAVVLVLVSMGACSNNKTASVSASDAASTVGAIFQLPADQQSCLQQHFADTPRARKVFVGQAVAAADDLAALGQIEEACIPVETLAASVTDAFGSSLTDAQKTCLTDGVTGLGADDRRKLVVGLSVSGSDALDSVGVAELGQVTNGLLDRCQLDTTTTQTTG